MKQDKNSNNKHCGLSGMIVEAEPLDLDTGKPDGMKEPMIHSFWVRDCFKRIIERIRDNISSSGYTIYLSGNEVIQIIKEEAGDELI